MKIFGIQGIQNQQRQKQKQQVRKYEDRAYGESWGLKWPGSKSVRKMKSRHWGNHITGRQRRRQEDREGIIWDKKEVNCVPVLGYWDCEGLLLFIISFDQNLHLKLHRNMKMLWIRGCDKLWNACTFPIWVSKDAILVLKLI